MLKFIVHKIKEEQKKTKKLLFIIIIYFFFPFASFISTFKSSNGRYYNDLLGTMRHIIYI